MNLIEWESRLSGFGPDLALQLRTRSNIPSLLRSTRLSGSGSEPALQIRARSGIAELAQKCSLRRVDRNNPLGGQDFLPIGNFRTWDGNSHSLSRTTQKRLLRLKKQKIRLMNLTEWERASVAPVQNWHFSSELVPNIPNSLQKSSPPPCRVTFV
ncbi:hypothetical protein CEXT_544581 [Caerostris extrusa]|uniref:Uncharacterized protein n=1 Tax=Caerostris extrusa TaxID=172846 RepID=A0AAV4QB31_CAEEX|nr:hypothetical protein CEXT_544581 [Caerostris extrusa]